MRALRCRYVRHGWSGKRPVVEPLAPELARAPHAVRRRREAVGALVVRPAERDEQRVALLHGGERVCAAPLEPDTHVRDEAQPQVGAGRAGGCAPVAGPVVVPLGADGPVVEHRLAVERELDGPVDALDRAQQDVLGLVVARRAAMRRGALLVVIPGGHEEGVADDHPARRGLPRRLEDVGAGQVAPAGGNHDVGRAHAEAARRAIEQGAEHARPVGPRQAHPLDVAAWRDERVALAVRQEAVGGDGREGRGAVEGIALRNLDLLHRRARVEPVVHADSLVRFCARCGVYARGAAVTRGRLSARGAASRSARPSWRSLRTRRAR